MLASNFENGQEAADQKYGKYLPERHCGVGHAWRCLGCTEGRKEG
jgi:hypothetical protein